MLKIIIRLMKYKNSLFLMLLVMPCISFAASTTPMPWDSSFTIITKDLMGPVAFGLSIIATFAAFVTLLFGNLQGGGKWLVIVALVISGISGIPGLVHTFGLSGAIIY